jgi:hypothetical protein
MTTRKVQVGNTQQVIFSQFLKNVEGMPEGETVECVTLSTPHAPSETQRVRALEIVRSQDYVEWRA